MGGCKDEEQAEMAKKSGKHVENARKKVETRPYKLGEAAELIKKTHHTKFNETVELAINLGVDPKHSDQVVRGRNRQHQSEERDQQRTFAHQDRKSVV